MIRLDKFLSDMGCGSRSEIKNKIRKGMVSVNNVIVKSPEAKVDETCDRVLLQNEPVIYVRFEYFMLNKPAGYVSATEDAWEKTIMELLPMRRRNDLFPVGRLDKDTEGLLLISNDGDMAHRLLSPRNHVEKIYYVKVDGTLGDEHVEKFKRGVDIGENIITGPGKLVILNSGDESEAELTIYEGKFHQVKRMFESVGMKVRYLKRLKFGNLRLDESLAAGSCRKLTENEVIKLKES